MYLTNKYKCESKKTKYKLKIVDKITSIAGDSHTPLFITDKSQRKSKKYSWN